MKLSIGKAWEEASAFLIRESRVVAPVALALFALPTVLLNWASPTGQPAAANGGSMIGLLVILVAAMIGQMTIILLSISWHGSIGEAMGKAARRVPALIGSALILFAPLLIIFSVAIAAVLVAAGVTNPAMMNPATMMKVPAVSWLTLLMIGVMLFVAVRLFAMSAVAANETGGSIAILKRSWGLSRGQAWRLLALVLLLVVVLLVLSSAVSVVVGSVTRLTLGEPRAFTVAALVIALAGGIVTALVSSVSAAMTGRVYAQLAGDRTAA